MSPTALLVIVVAAGDAGDATALAMQAAAREALGGAGAVELRTLDGESDAELFALERALGARAITRLIWRDAARTRAHLRVHISAPDQWVDRVVNFSPRDTPTERGRTLGFTAASMVLVTAPELARAPEPPTAPPTTTAVAVAPTPPNPTAAGRHAALLLGTGTGGVGAAWEWGGAVSFQRLFRNDLAASVGVGARSGHVESSAVTGVAADLAVGGAFWPLPLTPARSFSLALRAELLAMYSYFSRTTAMGVTERRSRWLPGLRLMAEAGWLLAREFELVVAAGPELAMGTIDLEVRNRVVATVPALRASVALGVRLRF